MQEAIIPPNNFFNCSFFWISFTFFFLWMANNMHLPARIACCLYLWPIEENSLTFRDSLKRNRIKAHPALFFWVPLSVDWFPSGKTILILSFPIFMFHWHSLPFISHYCVGWLFFSSIVPLTLILSPYSGPGFIDHWKLFISISLTPSPQISWIYLYNS